MKCRKVQQVRAGHFPVAGHPAASGGSLAPSSIGNFAPMSRVSENRTKINLEALFIRRLKVCVEGGGSSVIPESVVL